MSLVEGNGGTTMANFVVSLTQAAVVPVTFNIATANGTAAAGSDYTTTSRTGVTIPVGSKDTVVSVPVVGETTIESNETFQEVVARRQRRRGDGRRRHGDRHHPKRRHQAVYRRRQYHRGQCGHPLGHLHRQADKRLGQSGDFNIATANNTAAAGSDYAARSLVGQSIPAGSTSMTFSVNVIGDLTVEGNETYLVNVSGVKGAIVADAQAVGTIRNDDAILSIADASVAEGNSGTKTLA